ncbi:hypothetical protein [Streptomyces sp. NBC_00347]|uniref:hypothetical protein n=1 Tax=Streptomyces sp. NBC_00347 TaxID=2975721 RepID=UPI0022515D49|nr:hypothetical protein [Streptomyces sp. NBC_00347]MCX5129901.1 hypothetical protein [Streptomyces sp. NBC_00347]
MISTHTKEAATTRSARSRCSGTQPALYSLTPVPRLSRPAHLTVQTRFLVMRESG